MVDAVRGVVSFLLGNDCDDLVLIIVVLYKDV